MADWFLGGLRIQMGLYLKCVNEASVKAHHGSFPLTSSLVTRTGTPPFVISLLYVLYHFYLFILNQAQFTVAIM